MLSIFNKFVHTVPEKQQNRKPTLEAGRVDKPKRLKMDSDRVQINGLQVLEYNRLDF